MDRPARDTRAVITYKSPDEIEKMRHAGGIVAGALRAVRDALEPGVSTMDLDAVVRDFVRDRGGIPLFYRYRGFPANACVSINQEVVHGIPRKRRKVREGDIVKVDVGVRWQGYCGDSAWSFPVGEVGPDARRLLDAGRAALHRGIQECRDGRRISDIGRAIQAYSEGEGYQVVKSFVGHGIGKNLHEEPQVPNYLDIGALRKDPVLRPGLVIAIEPMLNVGTDEVETLDDGWTVVTRDRSLSVHFEHTVAVADGEPQILTLHEGAEEA